MRRLFALIFEDAGVNIDESKLVHPLASYTIAELVMEQNYHREGSFASD